MKCLINGIAYDALNNFQITEQAGNKTASYISVLVESQPIPVAGDVIELLDNYNNSIFLGTCGIPTSPTFRTGLEDKIYSITCNNANSILAYRIVNEAYQNATITEIVQNLFDRYISEEGITLGTISNVEVTYEVYTAADYNLQACLNELADQVGAIWKINTDRTFDFLIQDDFPKFQDEINEEFLLGADYQHKTKDYKTRTVQYISGATDTTSAQLENYEWETDVRSLALSFPLIQQPVIYINGTQVDPAYIGVNGLDDSDPNIIFSWSYNSQIINIKRTDTLNIGDNIVVQYIGLFPIRVVARNASKIEEIATKTGTSGKREMVQIATDITTNKDAQQLASSLLSQFEEATSELTFWLLSRQLDDLGMSMEDLELMTQVSFDLPSIGITGDYVVCERTLSMVFPEGSYERQMKIELTLKNRDYLKSSGEIISSLYRGLNQLAVRSEDLVVNQEYMQEQVNLSEDYIMGDGLAFYANTTHIFSPFSLSGTYYPTPHSAYSGIIEYMPERYPSQDTNIFIPMLGDFYPV